MYCVCANGSHVQNIQSHGYHYSSHHIQNTPDYTSKYYHLLYMSCVCFHYNIHCIP